MTSDAHEPAPLVLIVDDERDIADMLDSYFRLEGYRTLVALDAAGALADARRSPDAVLLDVNLPDADGFSVCREMRELVTCPIIFLTARVEDADELSGFAAGGDDYVTKPFSLEVLGARVRAQLARDRRALDRATVRFSGGVSVDLARREVRVGDRVAQLTRKDFDIVALLAKRPGQVFGRDMIYERVWGESGDSSVVTEHVRRIRRALAEAGCEVFVACLAVAGRRFYRDRLAGPIAAMDDAAGRIASGDLDFSVAPQRADELGRLCGQFEAMRAELERAEGKLWRAAESRRQVNAAFAHDLRTPLTVVRGQAELIGRAAEGEEVRALSRIADNLVANAARYARGEVRLSLSWTNGTLELSVADDGPGFGAAALAHADEPFWGESKGRGGHLGLGLYVSRLLAEKHGGALEVANGSNGGGLVRVTLSAPARRPSSPSPSAT